jgi:hypothetical protein
MIQIVLVLKACGEILMKIIMTGRRRSLAAKASILYPYLGYLPQEHLGQVTHCYKIDQHFESP